MHALVATALAACAPGLIFAQVLPALPYKKTVSDAHIRTTANYLDQISALLFIESGKRYLTPRVTGYDNTVMTPCGE
ncbi:MAG: hypothetical protein ABI877_00730 [Gemmatimonadaceae bacterium]